MFEYLSGGQVASLSEEEYTKYLERKIAYLEKRLRFFENDDFVIEESDRTFLNLDGELVVCIPSEKRANRVIIRGEVLNKMKSKLK